jgi:hypothetical protein
MHGICHNFLWYCNLNGRLQYQRILAWKKWCIITCKWPPLWSSDQNSWLQICRSGFDSRLYQIFWEAVGLERGPLSLVSTIEELLRRNISVSGPENREHGRRDLSRWPRTPYWGQLSRCHLKMKAESIVRNVTKLKGNLSEYLKG